MIKKQIGIRFTDDTTQAVDLAATAQGITRTEFITRAVLAALLAAVQATQAPEQAPKASDTED